MRQRMVPAPAQACATALLVAAALLTGCVTTSPELAEGLSPAEYFQRAQEATAQHDYGLAMRWYAAFRERFADDPSPQEMVRLLWAEYEVAFLYHKMGDDEDRAPVAARTRAQLRTAGRGRLPGRPPRSGSARHHRAGPGGGRPGAAVAPGLKARRTARR